MTPSKSLSSCVLMCARLPLKAFCLVTCLVLLFFAASAPAQPGPPQYGSLTACAGMQLGTPSTSGAIGGALNGFVPFPSTNAWNTNIASAPVDPNSATLAAAFPVADLHAGFGAAVNGYDVPDNGIPYMVVDSTITPPEPIDVVEYADQSDVVVPPYPNNVPIEGAPTDCEYWPNSPSGNSHALVLDRATCWLYETFGTTGCNGQYEANSEAIWDMTGSGSRPWGWISADTAGLPVFAGLVRYDEASSGVINHALSFTMEETEGDSNNGYFVLPASDASSSSSTPDLLPLGTRLRLRASTDISGFSTINQTILTAMMNYGLILTDIGSNFYVQGTPDTRWSDSDLATWHGAAMGITQADFDVLQMTPEYPGMDSVSALTDYPGSVPAINSFTANDETSAITVSSGTPVTFDFSVTGDSYDYIDNIGPVRLTAGSGSATITPTATQEYTLYSTNATGQTSSTIEVTVTGSVVTPPVFTPPPSETGVLSANQKVTISTPTSPSATIYYTLTKATSGTTPTTASTRYNGSYVTVNTGSATYTVEAIAVVNGYSSPSAASSATYIHGAKTATPSFSPAAGTYTGAQTVTISDATGGATIYYTTDGTTPTTNSAVYSAPITVAATETLKAIATASGDATSGVGSAAITLTAAAAPTFNPLAGTYTTIQSVTISDTAPGATIYYTTDGSAPTTGSTVYITPLTVSVTQTIKAIATAYGYPTSSVGSAKFTINLPQAATPTFNPAAGTYNSAQSVTISDTTVGTDSNPAVIYYTTDGTVPTTNSTIYTAPIPVTATDTLKAIATATGYTASATGSAVYTLQVATPAFSPGAGTYTTIQTVTINDSTAGATIYYTTSGSAPTTNSAIYSTPLTVSITQTLKAMAAESGYSNSTVGSAKYTINLPAAATPAFSPTAGTYNSAQSVTISDSTVGTDSNPAVIYYTTDGTAPTTSSAVYSAPVTVSASDTLKAIATATGYNTSATGSAAYTLQVATPAFSPVAGTYTSIQSVTISDTTAGATIYYTTNATTPTTNSTVYTAPITVSATQTLKAIATESGYTNSTAGSAVFTINLPQAATPTFSPVAGTYNSAQTVTISDITVGTDSNPAVIYYTTDGTAPTTNSAVYAAPITVSATETLKAIATAYNYSTSAIGSAVYTLQAATPSFSPMAGTYTSIQSVTISDSTAGATIYYTTNGSAPTTASAIYSTPLTVSVTQTLKAIAATAGYTNSAAGSAVYTINLPAAATPSFNPAVGTYYSAQTVTISDTTVGTDSNPAVIYYTTNGAAPTTNSTVYTAPITVSVTETLKAIATATGYSTSATGVAAYTLKATTPTFNPAAGTYTTIQTVTISTTTPSATIYYTTDGTTPTTASTVYTAPVTVSVTQTLKAIAVLAGYTNSTVGSAKYTINLPIAGTPTFSPVSGTYSSVQLVTISDTAPGATIYYTMDGSTPTTGSNIYVGPVTIWGSASTTTLNAIATAYNYNISAVGTAAYNVPYVPAALSSPTPGTQLGSTSPTFTWTPGTGGSTWYPGDSHTLFELWVGSTGVGSSNLYDSGPTQNDSTNVTGLPNNGETLYVRLYWLVNVAWQTADYTYKASGSPTPATMSTPAQGSTLSGASQAFTWNPGNIATHFELWVGTTGVGSSNLYNSGNVTATTETVNNLPTNGEPVYVRLYSLINGAWQSNDYTYTASGAPTPATMSTPGQGSILAGASQAFTWNPGNIATHFELWVGTTGVGSSNLYNSGNVTVTTETVNNLPTNGEPVYVRLYSLINGAWQANDYTYTASGSPTPAALTTPTPGSQFLSSTETFVWTPGNTATHFELWLGSTGVGSSNLYNSGNVTVTTETVSGLPTNGETVYARLYWLIDGAWHSADYTYMAQ